MREKNHIMIIHGGMTFARQKDYVHFLQTREISIEKKVRWREDYLDQKLGKDFDIIRPRMPLADNARYAHWKIHFERHIPYVKDNIIFIGISLGGIFLAKYLAENTFPKKILATFLICPPYDNTLPTEDLVGGFTLPSDLSRIEKNSPQTFLLFSRDDDVVPIAHAEKYRAKLPHAHITIYDSKNGHFRIAEFPEIAQMIKTVQKTCDG